jgi:cell division septation protein DedD
LITPRPGETYLQLAALVPRTVLRYLDELRADDLEPCVAPGPTPELLRVLVGPFPDKDSLTKAKAKLDAQKIVWLVRSY